jgi:hypothetical protein
MSGIQQQRGYPVQPQPFVISRGAVFTGQRTTIARQLANLDIDFEKDAHICDLPLRRSWLWLRLKFAGSPSGHLGYPHPHP